MNIFVGLEVIRTQFTYHHRFRSILKLELLFTWGHVGHLSRILRAMIYIIFRYVLTTNKSSKMHKNRHLQFTNAHRLRQELKAIASTINPAGWTNVSKLGRQAQVPEHGSSFTMPQISHLRPIHRPPMRMLVDYVIFQKSVIRSLIIITIINV